MESLNKVKMLALVYGGFSAVVLGAVVAESIAGYEVSGFMWGRAGGMFASAVVAYWLTGLAARGSRGAFIRLRIISVVVPIAVVAIDCSVPGALPLWFVVLQVAGAVALVPAAFIVNRMRAAFAPAGGRARRESAAGRTRT
ncbi:hypothetical protein [Amycolatopsis jejuensis]|uniref:hypothetical protein n=1 Tax=Amycolatopsis jejuensis TaxID=330084 RepID=UPI0012E023CD|nr:hypothetical protein [Amycolatopsis jejuensis]